MAHHKSAKKRIRSTARRNEQNKTYLSKVRTAVKKFRISLQELSTGGKSADEVQALYKTAQSFLAKASTKGILHKKNVSRSIGRLSAQMVKAQKPSEGAATGAVKKTKKKAAKKTTAKKKTTKKKKS